MPLCWGGGGGGHHLVTPLSCVSPLLFVFGGCGFFVCVWRNFFFACLYDAFLFVMDNNVCLCVYVLIIIHHLG